MPVSQPCADLLLEALNRSLAFLNSNEGHFFFASLATARAIAFYLGRSRLSQARELAAALLMAMIFAIVLAATESRTSKLIMAGLECKSFEITGNAMELTARVDHDPQR
ncbi:MAG: hypothetical protein ACLPWS_19425 [Rhodomicrobium sp.]